MLETEAFYILLERYGLFDVVVLGDIVGPYRVVDQDAVDLIVLIGGTDLLLQGFSVDASQVEGETAVVIESAAVQPLMDKPRRFGDESNSGEQGSSHEQHLLLLAGLLRVLCVLHCRLVVVG